MFDTSARSENNPTKFSTKVFEVEIDFTPPVHVWESSAERITAQSLGLLEVPIRYYAEDQVRDQNSFHNF